MKRLHVHVAVRDLEASVRYYTTLYGMPPTVHQHDYAKWLLEDPRVNFAISARDRSPGLDHLGIQVEEATELETVTARLRNAQQTLTIETDAHCCYARSNKTWSIDPSGIRWENFHTYGTSTTYGPESSLAASACCSDSSNCSTTKPV